MNKYIVINYHYIRNVWDDGIKACSIENFSKHIEFLNENYKIVSLPNIYQAVQENREGNFCSLTFDDGLLEHYEIVFTLLKKYKLSGTFFPIGLSLAEKRLPLSHKTQFILSKTGVPELVNLFHKFFNGKYKIDDKIRIEPKRQFDDVLTSNLKETLIRLPFIERKTFIEKVFKNLYPDEIKEAENLFLSPKELKQMFMEGMIIGAHTYNHISLETLNFHQQEAEIRSGAKVLKDILGQDSTIFAYPHTRYNQDTLKILENLKFNLALWGGRRELKKDDNPLLIPRYDVNDIDKMIQNKK